MAASSLQAITLAFADPATFPTTSSNEFHRIDANISFNYLLSTNIRTLSTNDASPGNDVNGLLYTPDLPSGSVCITASEDYVPQNVTRLADLPETQLNLIAIAPWVSPECTAAYLEAAGNDPVQGFIFFLVGNGYANDSSAPPLGNSNDWVIGDGGKWKSSSHFPVYAVPGQTGSALMDASAQYSGNLSQVPFSSDLATEYGPADFVRLYVDLNTTGGGVNLPSLWVFLLVVLGILLAVIGCTSLCMHMIQRRRRRTLRQRVANGEVDLEALGIKRLTVPQNLLDQMPLYTYGSGTPVAISALEPSDKLGSAHSSRPTSPVHATAPIKPSPPPPVIARNTNFQPTALNQPTCPICLEDFISAPPASSPSAEQGSTVRELPCHHIFHPSCVDAFLRDNSSLCPMCKTSALPKGYCPTAVTNAMVRRERILARARERRGVGENVVLPADGAAGGRRSGWMAWRRASTVPFVQREETGTEMPTRVSRASLAPVAPPINDANPSRRREWARQRAIAMLGGTPALAPVDPEVDERAQTKGWRRMVRGVFPGFGR